MSGAADEGFSINSLKMDGPSAKEMGLQPISIDHFDLHGYKLLPPMIDALARCGMFPTNVTIKQNPLKPIFHWDNPLVLEYSEILQKEYIEWTDAIRERFSTMNNGNCSISDIRLANMIAEGQAAFKLLDSDEAKKKSKKKSKKKAQAKKKAQEELEAAHEEDKVDPDPPIYTRSSVSNLPEEEEEE